VKVLHVQKVGGIGGSERHLLSLLPALVDAGVEVRMYVAATDRAADFINQLHQLGVPHSAVSAGPDANPLLLGSLWRDVRRFRPDLVHTHLVHADLHGQLAARLAGTRGISSVHGTPRFYLREPYRTARRTAGRWTTRTIAISEHVRGFVERLGLARAGTIRTVHYGIDASGWPSSSEERRAVRANLGFANGDVVVGVASRLIAGKGHPVLLEAHARASREVPRLRLVIAGDGPLRVELERQASDLACDRRVRFTGFIADVRSFMGACDVFAFPTQPELGEGFGLAALEAMAASRPVIATRVGSLPEVVRDNVTGLLVEPGSVEDLAAALVHLAKNAGLRKRMGERARTRAQEDFSLELMIERTLAVYDDCLNNPRIFVQP
jgi:glycosyltransferase involved in cell wall biosynthesis